MGWENVGNSAIDIKQSKEAHEGYYRGKKDITTKIGPQVIYQFQGEDGSEFGIYGFTNLNRAMETVPLGALCRVKYEGTKNVQTKFGMKDVHQVAVSIWKEDADELAEPGE
jgi:hypothetical protein